MREFLEKSFYFKHSVFEIGKTNEMERCKITYFET